MPRGLKASADLLISEHGARSTEHGAWGPWGMVGGSASRYGAVMEPGAVGLHMGEVGLPLPCASRYGAVAAP